MKDNENQEDTNSPFAHEVQQSVARLLAKENINVHRSYSYKSAFFDVKSRTMGLPIIKGVPNEVYSLFIGHEIGHALYSALEDSISFQKQFPRYFMVYNILEDIRIEKKCLDVYPGLLRDFRIGYNHLFSTGFFGARSQNHLMMQTLNLLDRLNLHAKVGRYGIPVKFSAVEQAIVDEAMAITTHADLIKVAEKLIALHIQEPETIPNLKGLPKCEVEAPEATSDPDPEPIVDDSESDDTRESSESDRDEDSDSESDDSSESSDDSESDDDDCESKNISADEDAETSGKTDSDFNGEPDPMGDSQLIESETQQALEDTIAKKASEMPEDEYVGDVEFLPPLKEELDAVIVGYKRILEIRDADPFYKKWNENIDKELLIQYKNFQLETKKTVRLLANEFERKKAAFGSSRAQESRKGTLNVNAMHRYKYSDDIFNSMLTIADTKSHGMVFLVDFSASMHDMIVAVMKKVIMLTSFCKVVNIPFEVYTFTTQHPATTVKAKNDIPESLRFNRINLLGLGLNQVLSSQMSKNDYDRGCRDLFFSLRQSVDFSLAISNYERMGSTPLLEAVVAIHSILKNFIATHNITVPNLMILSDGAGSDLRYLDENGKSFRACQNRQGTAYGKISKRRISLPLGNDSTTQLSMHNQTLQVLLENIKAEFNANTICFFIGCSLNRLVKYTWKISGHVIRKQMNADETAVRRCFKNTGIYAIKNIMGYNKYIYMFDPTHRQYETSYFGEWETETDDIKDVAKSFKAFTGAKLQQRTFVRELIDTICANF